MTEETGMSEARQGEIALLYVRYRFHQDGVVPNPNNNSLANSVAEAAQIDTEEAREFLDAQYKELIPPFVLKRQKQK